MSSAKVNAENKEWFRSISPAAWEIRRVSVLRHYASMRKSYFGDAIPEARYVSIVFLSPAVIEKTTEGQPCDGFCVWDRDNTIALIAIRDNCSHSEGLETLLHEMAHMKVEAAFGFRDMGHGKNFKAEIRRLQNAGAYDEIL